MSWQNLGADLFSAGSALQLLRLPSFQLLLRQLANELSQEMRKRIGPSLEVIIRNAFVANQYNSAQPSGCFVGILGSGAFQGFAVISKQTGYNFLELLLGGLNLPKPSDYRGRALTDIEASLLKNVFELIALSVELVFSRIGIHLKLHLESLKFSLEAAHSLFEQTQSFIQITLEFVLPKQKSQIDLLLPYSMLRSFKSILISQSTDSSQKQPTSLLHLMEQFISSTTVKLSLGIDEGLKTSLSQLKGWKKGDTIIMQHNANEDFGLFVNGSAIGKGKIGRIGNNIAALITEVFAKSDEQNQQDDASFIQDVIE